MEGPGGRGVSLRNEGASPASEAQATASEKKPARIWSIGELGGGTEYFGRDNLYGIYALLKDRASQNTPPNAIFFLGEGFPEVSEWVSRSGRSKGLVLTKPISGLDESVVFMKPHLSRITSLIKRKHLKTHVTYILGHSDIMNKDREYKILTSAFDSNPSHFVTSRANYKQRLDELDGTIKNIETVKAKLEQELKELEQKFSAERKKNPISQRTKNLEKGVENYKKKIGYENEKLYQRKDEHADIQKIYGLYTGLLMLWMSDKSRDLKEIMKSLKDVLTHDIVDLATEVRGEETKDEIRLEVEESKRRIDEIRAEIAGMDPKKGKAKISKLENEARELSNKLTRLSHDTIIEEKIDAEKKKQKKVRSGLKYTGNTPGNPDEVDPADALAEAIITTSIKDAFGRRIHINIVTDNTAIINVNGLKVLVTNKASNTSHHFTRLKRMGDASDAESDTVDMIIKGRSPYGEVRLVPRHNLSKDYRYELTTPPCVDLEGLRGQWNRRRKTWFTEIVGKFNPSSGFDEVVFDGKGFHHTFFTSEGLEYKADAEKIMELKVLAKLIKGTQSVKGAGVGEQSDVEKLPRKETLQLMSKLPSELRGSRLVGRLLVHLGVDPNSTQLKADLANMIEHQDFSNPSPELNKATEWISKYLAPKRSSREVWDANFRLMTDAHIGSPGEGYPNRLLLRDMVRYANERMKGHYIMLYPGDDAEGNLRNHKDEAYPENDPTNIFRFMESIESKGIRRGSPAFNQQVDEYTAWIGYKTPIQSFDHQIAIFCHETYPQSEGADGIVVAGGNHGGGTFPDGISNEANRMRDYLLARLPPEKRANVVTYPGGNYGHGPVDIPGYPGLYVAHKINVEQMVSKLRLSERIILGGHVHEHVATIVANRIGLTGLAMQGITNFPNTINIPISDNLRGMSTLNVKYDQDNIPLSYTDSYITVERLRQEGYLKENPLIREFEASLNRMKVPRQKAVSL